MGPAGRVARALVFGNLDSLGLGMSVHGVWWTGHLRQRWAGDVWLGGFEMK